MSEPELFRPEISRAAPRPRPAEPDAPIFPPEHRRGVALPAAPGEAPAPAPPARPLRGGVGLLLAGAGLLGLAWLAEALWRWLQQGGAAAWLALLGGGLLATGGARIAWREWAALRALDEAAGIRTEQAAAGENFAAMMHSLERLGARLRARGATDAAALARWREAAGGVPDAAGLQAAFVREVIEPLDQRALQAAAEAARGAAVLGMVSPTPLGDLLLFLGRAVLLLRRVSGIYGLRPGRLAEWRLMGRILADAALVAVTDAASEAVASAGGKWLGFVLGRAAEAGVTGQRMARFGLLAMTACRPVPFDPDNSPGLREVVARAFAGPEAEASALGGGRL